MESNTLPINPVSSIKPINPENKISDLKRYIIWISVVLILFLILAYFLPMVPCKEKTIKTSLVCTPELEKLGECVYQEIQLSPWKLCSLKGIFNKNKEST